MLTAIVLTVKGSRGNEAVTGSQFSEFLPYLMSKAGILSPVLQKGN